MKIPLLTQPAFLDEIIQDEYPSNFEHKLPLVFVLDVSTSMQGEGIRQLNEGLKVFESHLIEDSVAFARLDVSIVTFGSDVQVVRKFSQLGNPPFTTSKAGGRTMLREGLETALRVLEARKAWYKSMGLQYYRPYIILITDGAPWPNKNLGKLPDEIRQQMDNNGFVFQSFGAGNANVKVLKKLSHTDFPPIRIEGHRFEDFFKWLTPSISFVIHSFGRQKKENSNPFLLINP